MAGVSCPRWRGLGFSFWFPPHTHAHTRTYPPHIITITINTLTTLTADRCEPYLSGQYRKHNGNNGYVSSFERNTPHAFSHYTYEKSHGELVVVDIQGVDDYYTDPQIHTIHQKRFGMGNFGSVRHLCLSICFFFFF